jgi:hypothetical protein
MPTLLNLGIEGVAAPTKTVEVIYPLRELRRTARNRNGN